jgi:hypothetical protein
MFLCRVKGTMHEREIFLKACEISNLGSPAALLEMICGSDAVFRRRIQVLLAAHAIADDFLEIPAIDQLMNRRSHNPQSDGK